ncbi:unnamed protein product [Meganyctiphanes norvegica]|uniref:Uncharacterized protein n=1 Tax=Meganyctiphanes norvegica TaxID=48144 RepID=A0AAV2QQN9_MEGNR
MGAMTCHRGAMLVTLILVATAASCHGARPSSSLADMLMAGHSGEVFLVEEKDIPNLKIPKPLKSWSTLKPSIPKPVLVGSGLNVGVGLNIEDPDDGLEMLGPVLILGNNLRRRRQHHSESNITNETDELATDTPIETTINPFNNGLEENDYETTLGPLLFDRRISSTAPPPTPDESTLNLTDVYDTTIKDNSDTESNVAIETASNIVSAPEFQEITVGTKVNLGGPKVTGEVIPVELKSNPQVEKEHKSEGGIELNSDREDDQITSVSDRPERPGTSSLLGSLLNWWTETPEKPLQKRPQRPESPERPLQERPQIFRPERPGIRPERPGTQSGERPEFRPFTFRPRPRPTENRPDILPPRPTENRPDILPPRLRLPPIVADPISDITTNRPLDTTIISDDSPAEEPPLRSPIRFTSRPRPTGLLNKPSSRPGFLPSKPVIESGFQGIRDEFGNTRPAGLFRPGAPEEINDNDYDSDALPPSLPNLKIIPFVAADALTNQPEGNIDSFAGDDFRISLQEEPATTTTTTTTTEASIRRPFVPGIRRPPILPARRPLRPDANGRPNINGRPNSTGRPSPFAPGQRPTRPGTRRPFLPPRNTPRDKITSEENSIAPSSTTPSSPPILRFTSKKPATEFTLLPVEKTTIFVQPEPEEEVTTDDLPSIESNTVNTPEGPLRLPGPIITKTTESSSSSSISSKPIKTDDISNLFLQDIFGQPEGTKRPPVRFIPASSKPITPTKTRTPLPAIPSLITNLFPLAPDPIVAQGLLKLSGCNIYGRMYNIDDRISELSAKCKECRCTPVGVQCLPVCA